MKRKTPAEVLCAMATTFKARNSGYKDSYKIAAKMLEAMFPDGMPADHEVGHLLSLMVVKISRFSQSGMRHVDSIHDTSVYGAMIESILHNRKVK